MGHLLTAPLLLVLSLCTPAPALAFPQRLEVNSLAASALQVRAAGSTTGGVWTSRGCYTDQSSPQRTLNAAEWTDDVNMTVGLCQNWCLAGGYTWAGLEYSGQCYCSNTVFAGSQVDTGAQACNSKCAGDRSSICGGTWRLSMYSYGASSTSTNVVAPVVTTTWTSKGCYNDGSPRVLAGISWSDSQMTVLMCQNYCSYLGYSWAGIEYSTECYCSNALSSGATIAPASDCNTACGGDSKQTCGGTWRISIYSATTSTSLPSISASTSASASASSTPSTTSTPTSSLTSVATPTSSASVALPTTANKAVYVHFMVGNTYAYTYDTWRQQIALASAAGFDGFALNLGMDYWQTGVAGADGYDANKGLQIAYKAAKDSGTNFKLFLSLDMTVWPCSANYHATPLVNLVKTWASHSNQATYKGKTLVGTFAGSDCTFGTSDWNTGFWNNFRAPLQNQGVNIYFAPAVFSDVSTFQAQTGMDAGFNWNSGWPMSKTQIDWSSDTRWLNALGSKGYMAAVSGPFYTHYAPSSWNKNWLFYSDGFMFAKRWQLLVNNRSKLDLIEALTWNDFGESCYLGPITSELPGPVWNNAADWVIGMDHTALLDINAYYATAFKTSQFPPINKDRIWLSARPHTNQAYVPNEVAGRPTGGQFGTPDGYLWPDDKFFAFVLATAPGTVVLQSGSYTTTAAVVAGPNFIECNLAIGSGMKATLTRNSQTVVTLQPTFTFLAKPSNNVYNFNYNFFASPA